jgi:hypothetical protein
MGHPIISYRPGCDLIVALLLVLGKNQFVKLVRTGVLPSTRVNPHGGPSVPCSLESTIETRGEEPQ